VSVEPGLHDFDDDLVRREQAGARKFRRSGAEFRAGRLLLAQDRAYGRSLDAVFLANHLRLRALAGGGRSQEHDTLFHRLLR